jgi:L-histidine Nalpha-methyltransferase
MSALPLITAVPEIASEVLQGLTRRPKSLPPRLFYDAQGSALFEAITQLPEYYLTRTEHSILSAHAAEMVEQAGSNLTVFELGAGTAAKTGSVLAALLRRQLRVEYYPIDVSPAALRVAAERLSRGFPNLLVHPVTADYTSGVAHLERVSGRRLLLYFGSSIGNFEPSEAGQLLRNLRRSLHRGDALLLGTDMVKSTDVLVPAYDDPQGVTASFNKNVLVRINRELDANFDLDRFRHVARWNRARSRMEMHLESRCDQQVDIRALGLGVDFSAGEGIHTENSYKYTLPTVRSILRTGGFHLERTWMDFRRWFSVHLARVV